MTPDAKVILHRIREIRTAVVKISAVNCNAISKREKTLKRCVNNSDRRMLRLKGKIAKLRLALSYNQLHKNI